MLCDAACGSREPSNFLPRGLDGLLPCVRNARRHPLGGPPTDSLWSFDGATEASERGTNGTTRQVEWDGSSSSLRRQSTMRERGEVRAELLFFPSPSASSMRRRSSPRQVAASGAWRAATSAFGHWGQELRPSTTQVRLHTRILPTPSSWLAVGVCFGCADGCAH